jgi:predicted RNA-binding Zn ribbon-like protein
LPFASALSVIRRDYPAQDWSERRPRREVGWEIWRDDAGGKWDRLSAIRETTQMGPPSVFSPENRYATLEILRQFLSLWQVEQDERKAGIRIPEDRSAFARAWARVVPLVGERSLPRARRRYHRLPVSTPADRHARLLALTYLTGGLGRVKRCPACSEWFVDFSRNRSGKRCSQHTWSWWNRERWRKADQASQRRGINRQADGRNDNGLLPPPDEIGRAGVEVTMKPLRQRATRPPTSCAGLKRDAPARRLPIFA